MSGDLQQNISKTDIHSYNSQKKTFTQWINYVLGEILVLDLFEDLKSGVVLGKLIKKLANDEKPLKLEKGNMRIHYIINVQNALNVIELHAGINLSQDFNIGAEDLVDGNQKITLGLVWILISNFQLIKAQTQAISPDSNSSDSNIQNAKYSLIQWVNNYLRRVNPMIKIEGLQGDLWRNGLGFLAILHSYDSELCPEYPEIYNNTINSNEHQRWVNNLEVAFELIERSKLGVPAMLDSVDLALKERVDERSLVTYLTSIRNEIENQSNEVNKESGILKSDVLDDCEFFYHHSQNVETELSKLIDKIDDIVRTENYLKYFEDELKDEFSTTGSLVEKSNAEYIELDKKLEKAIFFEDITVKQSQRTKDKLSHSITEINRLKDLLVVKFSSLYNIRRSFEKLNSFEPRILELRNRSSSIVRQFHDCFDPNIWNPKKMKFSAHMKNEKDIFISDLDKLDRDFMKACRNIPEPQRKDSLGSSKLSKVAGEIKLLKNLVNQMKHYEHLVGLLFQWMDDAQEIHEQLVQYNQICAKIYMCGNEQKFQDKFNHICRLFKKLGENYSKVSKYDNIRDKIETKFGDLRREIKNLKSRHQVLVERLNFTSQKRAKSRKTPRSLDEFSLLESSLSRNNSSIIIEDMLDRQVVETVKSSGFEVIVEKVPKFLHNNAEYSKSSKLYKFVRNKHSKIAYCKLIGDTKVMVRVGGGWKSLINFLEPPGLINQ